MFPHQPPFQDVAQVILPLSRAQLGPTYIGHPTAILADFTRKTKTNILGAIHNKRYSR